MAVIGVRPYSWPAAVVLFNSFSRSAWIGVTLSVAIVLFLSRLSRQTQKITLFITGGW